MIRMAARRDDLFTSTLTLGELLVRPLEMNRPDLADRYERMLGMRGIHIVDFDRDDELASMHRTTWMRTRGHAGHEDNTRCDWLAQNAAATLRSSCADGRPHAPLRL